MAKAKGYSLWLIPSDDVYSRLDKLISQLSEKYSTPYFEPHVTLIGELISSKGDIISKTAQVANVIRPYMIRLKKIEYLDEYFRCLFIRAEETDYVMEVNLKAREIFNRQQDPKYMPHSSLMYGNFSPQIKEEIIKEIGKEFNMNFRVGSIHLFSTDGEVKDWYRIKEFILK